MRDAKTDGVQRSNISMNARKAPGTSINLKDPRNIVWIALENSPGLDEGKKNTHMQQSDLANREKGFFKMSKLVFPQHIGELKPSTPFFECQFEKLKAIICEYTNRYTQNQA